MDQPFIANLCNEGIVINLAQFRQKMGANYNKFLKKLTITTLSKIGPPQIAQCYEINTKVIGNDKVRTQFIHLPRTLMDLLLQHKIVDRIDVNLSKGLRNVDYIFTGTLFPNQTIICDWLVANVFSAELRAAGKAAITLDLQAGLGKTFVAAGLIYRLKMRALYVTPRIHLRDQAYGDLNAVMTAKIGLFNSKHLDKVREQDVTIIVVDSALRQPSSFFNEYGLIIFDEVHMFCGPKKRSIFYKAQTDCVIGLSATTEHRGDCFDPIYHRAIGKVQKAADIPDYNEAAEKFIGAVDVVRYSGPPEFTVNTISPMTGKLFVPGIIKQFVADRWRNKLIINEAMKLYADERTYTYIFVENRLHAATITAMLNEKIKGIAIAEIPDANAVEEPEQEELETEELEPKEIEKPEVKPKDPRYLYESDDDYEEPENEEQLDEPEIILEPEVKPKVVILRGGATKEDKIAAKECRIIVTTYGYSGTGVSYQRMNCSIFGTPRRSNYEQICRRITRKGSDATFIRRYIDIVDENTSLKYQFSSRKKVYDIFEYTITKRKIKYLDIRL